MQRAFNDLSFSVYSLYRAARSFISRAVAFICTSIFIDSRAFTASVTCLIFMIILNLCLSSLCLLIASMQLRSRLDW